MVATTMQTARVVSLNSASQRLSAKRSATFRPAGFAALPAQKSRALRLRSSGQVHAAISIPTTGEPIQYNTTGKWRENFDLKGWATEVRAVEKELKAEASQKDVDHLNKILTWANLYWFGGVALAGVTAVMFQAINPIASYFMSTAIMARWTMVGHHVCHGGYNTVQSEGSQITGRFHRRTFARGVQRRITDWMDWMQPEAWDVEHNHLHHYELGEVSDPDLVERNFMDLRDGNLPMWARYGQVAFLMATWKWFYYAPNTLKELNAKKARQAEQNGETHVQPFTTGTNPSTVLSVSQDVLKGKFDSAVALAKCFAPYALFTFGVIPGVFYLGFGAQVATIMLVNLIIADVMTNIHSFIIIASNHVGDDVYRFETQTKPRTDDFYLRAVIGSVNFKTGGDKNDFMHGWLNYQIEHHMFPDMSMKNYQKAQPRVKAICEKYGVPYVQESVWKRLEQTVDVMVGKRNMLVWERGD